MKPLNLFLIATLAAAHTASASTVTINIDGAINTYTLNSLNVDGAGNATVSGSTGSQGTTNYSVTINQPTGGTISGASSGTYASGTSLTLTAAASSGYTFASWTGDCTGSSTTCTLTVNGTKTVSASFTSDGTSPPPPTSACVSDSTHICVTTNIPASNLAKTYYTPSGPSVEYAFMFKADTKSNDYGKINVARLSTSPASKLIVVSDRPFDFDVSNKARGCYIYNYEVSSITTLNAPSSFYCPLTPGATYYFNLISKSSPTATTYNCSSSADCKFSVDAY
jgi:uncharacterized repeat protein (TIGR02543 family)